MRKLQHGLLKKGTLIQFDCKTTNYIKVEKGQPYMVMQDKIVDDTAFNLIMVVKLGKTNTFAAFAKHIYYYESDVLEYETY